MDELRKRALVQKSSLFAHLKALPEFIDDLDQAPRDIVYDWRLGRRKAEHVSWPRVIVPGPGRQQIGSEPGQGARGQRGVKYDTPVWPVG